jgi:hypothetical protein
MSLFQHDLQRTAVIREFLAAFDTKDWRRQHRIRAANPDLCGVFDAIELNPSWRVYYA